MRTVSTTLKRIAPLVALALAFTAPEGRAQAPAADANAEVTKARATLSKYKDPIAAVNDGYLSTVACVDYPTGSGSMEEMPYKPGGMGVHLLNGSLIGPTLDPAKPQVLIYVPVGDKLELAAAEWFVPVALSKTPPMILGRSLEGPMEGHHPIMPPELHHWDLHVWLWKDNPSGMFHPTNPRVKCPKAGYSFSEGATKMVHPQ